MSDDFDDVPPTPLVSERVVLVPIERLDELAEALRVLVADTAQWDDDEYWICVSGVHCNGCGLDLPCGCPVEKARGALARYDAAKKETDNG